MAVSEAKKKEACERAMRLIGIPPENIKVIENAGIVEYTAIDASGTRVGIGYKGDNR